MQTTLLGLAIAAILALVAALVGPAFVDWGQYRANFEAEAARIAGQPVRIGGAIDVRILPTPTIMLRDVEVGPRAAPVFGAQAVRVELALDGLMRGELRAAALSLTGPGIAVALDANGQVVTHLRTLGFRSRPRRDRPARGRRRPPRAGGCRERRAHRARQARVRRRGAHADRSGQGRGRLRRRRASRSAIS